MYDLTTIAIQKKSEVLDRLNLSTYAVDCRVKNGIFPPPINLGGRSIGFIKQEVDIILQGMMLGKTINELRSLTSSLITFRQTSRINDDVMGRR
jgi:prophage regulatory protein